MKAFLASLLVGTAVCAAIGCNGTPSQPTPTPTPTPTCTFAVGDGPAGSVPAGGVEFTVSIAVAAGCSWTASSNSAFITPVGPTSGSGDGTVRFSVQSNSAASRQGAVVVANKTIDVRQDAFSPCAFSVSPDFYLIPETGGDAAFDVSVTAGQNCTWTASTGDAFISVKSGASGTGSGQAVFTVAPNPAEERLGGATVANFNVRIRQLAQPCLWTFTPPAYHATKFGATGLIFSFTKTAGGACPWHIGITNNWLTINPRTGTGNGTITVDIAPNSGAARGTQLDLTTDPNGPHIKITQHAGPASGGVTVAGRRKQ